jgi:threonine synthase
VALAALKKWVREGKARRSDRIVVISTAHGLKFSAFKNRYHAHQLPGIESRFANPVLEAEADYGRVREILLRALDARNAHIAARL